ncbi:MAG: hypothetical protein KIT87_28390, partial [Anaerolineae bacterium]|nr:hypothetical protein [Anaerolineae bacterium]
MWRQVRRGARVGMLCLLGLLLFNSASTALASEPEAYAGASLSGIVWQDYCASNCTAGSSLRRGNGQPDE